VVGGIVFLLLVLFRPFGMTDHRGWELIRYSAGFGLIGFAYLLLHFSIFERILKESSWTVWKEILNNLVVSCIIGILNYLYYCWYEDAPVELLPLVYFQLMTLEVGIVPFTIFAMVRQHQLVKKYQAESERIREEIPYRKKAGEDGEQDDLIKLKAHHPRNDFSCCLRR